MKTTLTKVSTQPVRPRLNDLLHRVEDLESANDSTQHHMAILLELLEIVKELPNGKQVYNRALNRFRLKYLQQSVLPRRTKELFDLSHSAMPKGIQQMFVDNQIQLIKSVTRAIKHRENFEHRASYFVKSVFSNVFSRFQRQSTRLSITSPHHSSIREAT